MITVNNLLLESWPDISLIVSGTSCEHKPRRDVSRANKLIMSSLLEPHSPSQSNKAILFYLHASGNDSAFEALKFESSNEELQLDDPQNKRFQGLLEKKWTSLIRLQKKASNPRWTMYLLGLIQLSHSDWGFRAEERSTRAGVDASSISSVEVECERSLAA